MYADVAEYLQRLANALGDELLRQHLMLTTAESCTAGGLAYAITLVPGSSQWFDRGFVTYSNDAKMQMLGVAPAYLRDFGAVSEPVARAMALGALSQSAAQVSVAATGIAGPGGATASKPVGTVCLAWALRRDPGRASWVKTETQNFVGDRAAVRTQSIVLALETLIGVLKAKPDVQAS
jgi:nicotinamide-nucleotide amidase